MPEERYFLPVAQNQLALPKNIYSTQMLFWLSMLHSVHLRLLHHRDSLHHDDVTENEIVNQHLFCSVLK